MINYCKGKKQDLEEIIDFANYIFSQNDRPHDFKKVLPKLYANGNNSACNHYLAKDNDKIKAMVCAEPLEYITPEENLKVCGIGMVSVHPYARGKGYMKELLKLAIEDLKGQGYAYLFLGGQRQRYAYFGFEPTGVQIKFIVTKTNIRHCFRSVSETGIEILPLTDEKMLDSAYALFEKQPFRMLRSRALFHDILRTWESSPYAVLRNGKFVGSFTLRADGAVAEFQLTQAELYPSVLRALFEMTGMNDHTFSFSPCETEKINFFLQISETWITATCKNYLILDWVAVIRAFLKQKAGYENLPDGELLIAIEDLTLEITVVHNVVTVQKSAKQADICLTALQATTFLFSSAGEFALNSYAAKLDDQKRACLKQWFPLPLFSSAADCC